MALIRASKVVAALPTTLEASTIYFVRVGAGFDLFVTNQSGTIVAYTQNLPVNVASIAGLTLAGNVGKVPAVKADASGFELVSAGGVPTFGGVGSLVVAATTAWSATVTSPGATVAGSTLVVSTTEPGYGALPLSASSEGYMTLYENTAGSLSLTGTWRALGRTYRANNGGNTPLPINVWERIA